MVQPKDPPLSVRLGAARLAKVDAFAARFELTRHAAILRMLDMASGLMTVTVVVKDAPTTTPQRAKVVSVEPAEKLRMPKAAYGQRLKKPR